MIEVKNITKKLGHKIVLDDVSFGLKQHGITSIIGPNGAGKSTLLALMARLLPLDTGQVSYDGLNLETTASHILAKKLAILTQTNQINTRLSVAQLAMFGRFPHHKGRPTSTDKQFVDKILDLMDLQDLRNRYLDELSGGQQQRAYIAMILCQDTEYILLDEPLNNLDMKHARNIMQSLRKIADQMNKTIILVIHDINFAASYSDQFIALKAGKLIARGNADEIMTEAKIKQIFDMHVSIKSIEGKKYILYHT